MKIRIHAPRVALPRRFPADLDRGLRFALARFGDRIESVILRLSKVVDEEGGPSRDAGRNTSEKGRGRADGAWRTRGILVAKRCEIEVTLHARKIRVEDTDADFAAAFARAVRRASRSVARAIEREHWWEPGPPTPLAPRFRARPAVAKPPPRSTRRRRRRDDD